jgi:proton translocating ATP synthase F1 alpha subunit
MLGARVGELVVVGPYKLSGIVLNLEHKFCRIIIMGSQALVKAEDFVKLTGTIISIKVNDQFLGRAVDALGNIIDKESDIALTEKENCSVELKAPGILARQGVYESLETGILAVDSMVPIGHGQRELIIGDRQTGKTSIAIDTIINQGRVRFFSTAGKPTVCVYVAIGQKISDTVFLLELLRRKKALHYTVLVAAGAAESATLQFLAPYTGTAIAEYFMYKGHPVVIVYDDLSKQAVAYRQMSLLLRRPPGREAFPGDVFYLHSRLLERAAKLNESKYKGGSLTALPIVETQAGDVSAYVPTNVISITDGQIYLEAELFTKGVRPALNFGLSVSRVGSMAQCKAMKSVSGPLKLELAQYREVSAFTSFAADLDYNTVMTIKKGIYLTELLKQERFNFVTMKAQVLLVIAGVQGHIDSVPVKEIQSFRRALISGVERNSS